MTAPMIGAIYGPPAAIVRLGWAAVNGALMAGASGPAGEVKWWAMGDSNLRPQRCQRCALTS